MPMGQQYKDNGSVLDHSHGQGTCSLPSLVSPNLPSSGVPLSCLQVVPLLMRAVGWHGASVLALETLKRLVTANNRARDALVGQGLRWGSQDTRISIFDTRISKTRYFRISAGALFRQSCSVLLFGAVFVIPFSMNLAGISLDVWTTACRDGL
jgi:hypothetical protein